MYFEIKLSNKIIFDDVNLPYGPKLLHFDFLNKFRGFRVLGADAVLIFSLIVGCPLWFLVLIEILKMFGVYGTKEGPENKLEDVIQKASHGEKEEVKELLELPSKDDSLFPEDGNNRNSDQINSINDA